MSTETELVKGIIQNGLGVVEHSLVDQEVYEQYNRILNTEKLNYVLPKINLNSSNWFMPEEYEKIDIEKYLIDICPKENYDRLLQELQEYKKRNLFSLLKQIKYIVETLKKNNVVWGVGRGSSVASYVLFLLEAHRIDSVKYNLPLDEFFKEI